MLRNHAENQWIIGTISGALQPIVVAQRLAGPAGQGALQLGADAR